MEEKEKTLNGSRDPEEAVEEAPMAYVGLERLFLLCMNMWEDYHVGGKEYESMKLEEYTRKYSVGKFPKHLAAPMLLKRERPTEEDAFQLKQMINAYVRFRRGLEGKKADEGDTAEQEAIGLLKGKGYRVMKQMAVYIDL